MAPINQNAIQTLSQTVNSLVPGTVSPGVDVITSIAVNKISPTGLGGFIELNDAQTADILGRHIKAELTIILQGNNLGHLQDSVALVTEALIGTETATLRDNGILNIEQGANEYQSLSGNNREFKLTFSLLYEYRHTPEEEEEVISDIPINLTMDIGEEN